MSERLLIRSDQKVRGRLFLLHLGTRRHETSGGQTEPKLLV
jgi:hypothetical protein